ncbi:MAG: MBL fold metallo-hydrolase [Planctomycetales bacterium]|nr:MBL fold metallo-hydrolase [Planctomycetales bacterium]NIM09043.1 MBL fold metallo-hydrolase [Planctomycetales bacterium]NIN08506.1 MBL fold metallo-hydrolase [Planctomycetales bacterium]NIN77640.1 MBL fold metallo-hydrolase [Planctomycetales bacterium]NIO34803.1 MBL fold metallo-hydrolase [Planctomycetales bacterium]
MQLGDWQLTTVNGGMFRLDGGVMFGVVPKSLWHNVVRADPQNRVPFANHCVLARNGVHNVLIDTGYGGKYDALQRKFYDMEEGEPLIRSLAELQMPLDQIDTVLFSHLHFDHVGGATRLDAGGARRLTFPQARHVVGRIEWEDATREAIELKTAYALEDILPLRHAQLDLVEDGQQILPGLKAILTGGHTRGHLAFLFESGGQAAIYLADICPSTAHLRHMWCPAYDTHPLDSRRRKPQLLGQVADGRWWVLWNHDPRLAASRIRRHPQREFVACDGLPRLGGTTDTWLSDKRQSNPNHQRKFC